MDERHFQIQVENSPTILLKVIQTIKRRRINIKRLSADEMEDSSGLVIIRIVLEADVEKTRLIKKQLEKLVDVIQIN